MSASQALSHPYFTSVANPAAYNPTPGAMGPPSYNFPHPHGHQAQQHLQQQMQYGRQPMMYPPQVQQVPMPHQIQGASTRVHSQAMNPQTFNPATNVPYPAPYPTR